MFRRKAIECMRKALKDRLNTRVSYSPGSLPTAWANCISDTGVRMVFELMEKNHYVRILQEPDDLSFDDLFGDAFDEANARYMAGGMRELEAQKRAAKNRLLEAGQWVHFVEFLNSDGDWAIADSIGGFVGDDFDHSGYAEGMMAEALSEFASARGLPPWWVCTHNDRERPFVFITTLLLSGVRLDGCDPEEFKWAQLDTQ